MNSGDAFAKCGRIVAGYLKGLGRFKIYFEFNLGGFSKARAVLGDVGGVKRGQKRLKGELAVVIGAQPAGSEAGEEGALTLLDGYPKSRCRVSNAAAADPNL